MQLAAFGKTRSTGVRLERTANPAYDALIY